MEEESGIRELAKAAAQGGMAPPPPELDPERKYKGVRRHRRCDKYSVEIRDAFCGRKLLFGSYDTAVEAARAYDAAVRTLRPDDAHAMTNFPEPPPATEEEKDKRAAVVDDLKLKRVDAAAVSAVAPHSPPPPAPAAKKMKTAEDVATSSPQAPEPLDQRLAALAIDDPPQLSLATAAFQTGTN